MNKNFTTEFCGEYISVRHAEGFEITSKSAKKVWLTLADECKAHNCRRVLREGAPSGRNMTWLEVYNSAVQAAKLVPGIRVAYCFENYTEDELTRFFKIVTSNRGVEIEFFSDRREALRWLGVKDRRDKFYVRERKVDSPFRLRQQILFIKILKKFLSYFSKRTR
jgi:hypothetical protein